MTEVVETGLILKILGQSWRYSCTLLPHNHNSRLVVSMLKNPLIVIRFFVPFILNHSAFYTFDFLLFGLLSHNPFITGLEIDCVCVVCEIGITYQLACPKYTNTPRHREERKNEHNIILIRRKNTTISKPAASPMTRRPTTHGELRIR